MEAVRPSQGRTLAVLQVCGGSPSVNVINTLRLLGRWMRMFTIRIQSSVPMAHKEFDDAGRMRACDYDEHRLQSTQQLVEFKNY